MESIHDEMIRKRNLRNAKHAFEDLNEAQGKIIRIGVICLGIGMIWLASYAIFRSHALYHSIISIAVGIGLITLKLLRFFNHKSSTIIIFIGYMATFSTAAFFLGYPSKLFPSGPYAHNVVSSLTLVNDITPHLYYGIQFFIAIAFLQILYRFWMVDKIPSKIIEELKKEGLT